jgi:membrane associated rhomboid family serine protease
MRPQDPSPSESGPAKPPFPWVTSIILGSTFAVFFFQLFELHLHGDDVVGHALAFSPRAWAEHHYWTLITYAWAHAVAMFNTSYFFWLHITANMFMLFCLGPALEDLLGPWRFLGLYVGGSIAAALFWFYFNLDADGAIIGASGAIFALIAGAGTAAPRARVGVYIVFLLPLMVILWPLSRMIHRIRRRLQKPINRTLWTTALIIQRLRQRIRRPYYGSLWIVALGFCLIEVLQVVLGWFPEIAHTAHLGGALFGFLYILAIRRLSPAPTLRD